MSAKVLNLTVILHRKKKQHLYQDEASMSLGIGGRGFF